MNNSKGLLFLTICLTALAAGGCGPSEEPEGETAEVMPEADGVPLTVEGGGSGESPC